MTELLSPLSAAKIAPPSVATHTMHRRRLLPDADVAQQLLLGVLIGPAGYGKTSAALQIATELDPDHCWYTIERADNDIARFLAYTCAALRLDSAISEEIAAAVYDPVRGSLFAADMLRAELERIERPTVLVLDDFHELTNPEILQAITNWLWVPPANFVLLCVGRTEPNLPINRIRAQGRLFELRSKDLAFDLHETVHMFDGAFGVTAPDPPSARAIHEATEGWPAPLFLAGSAASQSTSPAAALRSSEIDRYLRGVVRSLDTETVQFLSTTSVAEELMPELCDALTDATTSATVLQNLSDNECYVETVVETDPTFRCHGLLRDFLWHRLAAEDPERLQQYSRQASEWYHAHGYLAPAIRCAMTSNDVALGQRIVSSCWRTATDANNMRAVHDWATAVGPAGTAHRVVCIVLAWGAVAKHDEPNMRRWLARAAALTTTDDANMAVDISHHLILALWECQVGNAPAMLEHTNQPAHILGPPALGTFRSPGLTAMHGASGCMSGMAELLNGDLPTAEQTLTLTASFSRQPDHDHTLVDALSYLGLTCALAGQSENAAVHADEALARIAEQPSKLPSPDIAHLARSISSLGQDDSPLAEHHIALALATAHGTYQPIQRGLMHLQRARLLHRHGSLDAARDSLGAARTAARDLPASILDRQIRSVENELRFIGSGSNDHLPAGARDLTDRESDVLHLLPGPLSRGQIASELHISENTVKTHLTAISRKLGAKGRTSIVERAGELGLLTSSTHLTVSPPSPTSDGG